MTQVLDVDEFLEHHGVKGMKWGVQNEDDTSGDSSGSGEKKPRFSDKQKKAMLIGAGVVGTMLVAYGGYKLADSGQLNAAALRARQAVGLQDGPWKVNSKLADKNLTAEQLQSLVNKGANPTYGGPGTKTNCRRATFAYEMRRRGYDVSATRSHKGSGQGFIGMRNALSDDGSIISERKPARIVGALKEQRSISRGQDHTPYSDAREIFSGGGRNHINAKDNSMTWGIFSSLLGQPDGSRGEVSMEWGSGGRHSMAYEIVHGRPIMFDAQTGQSYQSAKDLRDDIGENILSAASTRLDNLPLNNAFLQRWLTNA